MSSDTDHYKYLAFLSYSHADNRDTPGERWGDWVHEALESFAVPPDLVGESSRFGTVPARIYPVFQDEKELPTRSALDEALKEALTDSRVLLVLCSPNSAASHWVNAEIQKFKQMGRGDRILALILSGEPNVAGKAGFQADAECFPPALRFALGAMERLTRPSRWSR